MLARWNREPFGDRLGVGLANSFKLNQIFKTALREDIRKLAEGSSGRYSD